MRKLIGIVVVVATVSRRCGQGCGFALGGHCTVRWGDPAWPCGL